jgi:DNA-binding transcriptional LysR family regulator
MNINIDWDKLRVFYSIARFQSFSLAAQQLNISQSALSRSVQVLEDRLKVKLFHRHTRGIVLTEKGTLIFKGAQQMLTALESTKASLSEMERSPHGLLKVRASAGIISRLLISNAKPFFETYPHLRLKIITGDDPPHFFLGDIEAAVFPYIQGEEESFLIQEYLLSFHLKLYASPDYLKKFGTPQCVEDLDHHQLLSYGEYPYPSANLNWHLSIGYSEGKIREPYMQVNLGHNLVALATQGIGIVTLAKESTNFKNPHDILVPVLPDVEGPEIKFYYTYPQHLKDSYRVQALGSYLHETAKREGLT